MMTPRRKTETTHVRTRANVLTPLEEKVLRMRFGLRAPDSLALEQVGQDNPILAAQIREIEARALQAAGSQKSAAKRRIVDSLRRKK